MEFWKHEVKNKSDGVVGNFNSTVATLGAGYVWSITRHFYLNPWAAVHVIVGGDTETVIGNDVYKTNRVTPEASLKLGWYF